MSGKLVSALIAPAFALCFATAAGAIPDDPKDGARREGASAKHVTLSEVKGYEVLGTNDEKLGSVETIAFDPQDGEILYFTLDPGALKSPIAIPWEVASFEHGTKQLNLPLTAKDVERAFAHSEEGVWLRETDTSWLPEAVQRSFKEARAERFKDAGHDGKTFESRAPGADDAPGAKRPAHPHGMGPVYPGSRIVGLDVKERDGGEPIGRVNEIVLDASSGRVVGYVIGTGGMLGFGETKLLAPREAIFVDPGSEPGSLASAHLQSTRITSRDDLRTAPRFEEDELDDAEYIERVRVFYGVSRSPEKRD